MLTGESDNTFGGRMTQPRRPTRRQHACRIHEGCQPTRCGAESRKEVQILPEKSQHGKRSKTFALPTARATATGSQGPSVSSSPPGASLRPQLPYLPENRLPCQSALNQSQGGQTLKRDYSVVWFPLSCGWDACMDGGEGSIKYPCILD